MQHDAKAKSRNILAAVSSNMARRRPHTELHKVICLVLIISHYADSYSGVGGIFNMEGLTQVSQPQYMGMVPGGVVFTVFYLPSNTSMPYDQGVSTYSHGATKELTDNPYSRLSARHKKQLGNLESIPYHRPFSSYTRPQSGYLTQPYEDLVSKIYEINKRNSFQGSFQFPLIEDNSYVFQNNIQSDIVTESQVPEASAYYTDIYDNMPRNHKHSKLRKVPYHAPFGKPRFLKAGYVQETFTKEPYTNEFGNDRSNVIAERNTKHSQTHLGGPVVEQKRDRSKLGDRSRGVADKLHSIPYHPPFTKMRPLRSGYLDDTHEVVVVVKKTTSAVVTKRIHL